MVDIYQMLNKVSIDDATQTQINTMTGRTKIDRHAIEFWQSVAMVQHAIKSAGTGPHGLPLPEGGAVKTVAVADSASGSIGPSNNEVWLLQNISIDGCSAGLIDTTTSAVSGIVTTADGASLQGPVYLTKTLHIIFLNSSGSEKTPGIAFNKVRL
jgi:hypothetical protein